MKNSFVLASILATAVLTACSDQPALTLSGLDPTKFETTINEKPVKLYTLKNAAGMEVCITNVGGRIVSIMVPDKDGKMQDVVLGYDNAAQYADYEGSPSDFGAAIGRYANRIKDGRIVVDGDTVQLPQNNFGHCLHGGPTGWQYQVYEVTDASDSALTLVMHSPDGDNNFPGNVEATVVYTLTDDNAIDIAFSATTDKQTVVNMTNHSYFNLNGDPTQNIENHQLYINADSYTPSDSTFMTTGEIVPVEGTAMDFTQPHAVGDHVNDFDLLPIKNANGYDHNWCLNTYSAPADNPAAPRRGDDTQVAASLTSPRTGICVEVYTDEPGIQIYSGNFLDGTVKGKHGIAYQKHAAICLETQHYPDSPNKPQWPSVYLAPGETYHSHCIYKFSVKR